MPNSASAAPGRAWPPVCAVAACGWQGEPDDQQSPYIACTIAGVTDPGRHQRTPVANPTTRPVEVTSPPTTPPARPPRPPRLRASTRGRGVITKAGQRYALAVACPSCSAAADTDCVTKAGGPSADVHVARVFAAQPKPG